MNALYEFAKTGGLPPFDKLAAEQVVPAIKALLEEVESARADIEATLEPSWDGAVERVNDLVEPIERAWGAVSHLIGVKNSPELRAAHQQVQPEVVAAFLKLSQSKPLYEALRRLKDGPVYASLSTERKRILDKKLLEAQLSGIGLPEDKQQRFL